MAMEKTRSDEVAIEFPFFRIYKDGRIDRFYGEDIVAPSPTAAAPAVRSKDVVIPSESGLSARLFLPQTPDPARKLPLLVYIHGGAFCIGTPFSHTYSNHAASLAAETNAVMLSVHYRRAPEHPLPAAYDDVWEALKWAVAHSGDGAGPEEWLSQHADFDRIFVCGDSAGANLAHYVVIRAGVDGLNLTGPKIAGLVLVHPFFCNEKPDMLLKIIFPTSNGSDDPRLNPGFDPNLARLGCGKVLIFVAEKDFLKDRGLAYHEALTKSGWSGLVEIVESEGVDHVFHLFNPKSEQAQALFKKISLFLNQAQAHI